MITILCLLFDFFFVFFIVLIFNRLYSYCVIHFIIRKKKCLYLTLSLFKSAFFILFIASFIASIYTQKMNPILIFSTETIKTYSFLQRITYTRLKIKIHIKKISMITNNIFTQESLLLLMSYLQKHHSIIIQHLH